MSLVEAYFSAHDKQAALFPAAAANGTLVTLMEVGSFYELYQTDEPPRGPDLERICKIMGIVRTRRNRKDAEADQGADLANPHLAGLPSSALRKYLDLLVTAGCTVVQIEQVTPPPAPERKVTRVHSPATNAEAVSETELSPELLVVVADAGGSWGGARVDLTTGKGWVSDGPGIEELRSWVARSTAREAVVAGPEGLVDDLPLAGDACVHASPVGGWPLARQQAVLGDVYKDRTGPLSPLEAVGLERNPAAGEAWARATEFCRVHDPTLFREPFFPVYQASCELVDIDSNAVFDLRVTARDKTQAGLLECVDRTSTAMGRRELRNRLLSPLRDAEAIGRRHADVRAARAGQNWKELLVRTGDVERAGRRWARGCLPPSRWPDFVDSCAAGGELLTLRGEGVTAAVVDELPASARTFDFEAMRRIGRWSDLRGTFVRPGVDALLDELVKKHEQTVRSMEKLESYAAGIIGAAPVMRSTDRDGWFLATTKKRGAAFREGRASGWTVKAAGNGTRLVCNELRSLGFARGGLETRMASLTREVYERVTKGLWGGLEPGSFAGFAARVAELDVALCSHLLMDERLYCLPELREGDRAVFSATGLRHPMVEASKSCRYVPHDLDLGGDAASGLCLFAPNAAGKSTLMAALGLATIMAQAGLPVPATSFGLVPVDGIFTRINALDRLGVSSFVSEMIQLRAILHRSTARSLVLSDEACNMTETVSAQSICVATLVRLVETRCAFVFSTHLHELASAERVSALGRELRFAHLSSDVLPTGEISYTRELLDGPGEPVYGLRVARHILRDPRFWKTAREVQRKLLAQHAHRPSRYNARVYIGACEICKQARAEHAHHILYQRDADKTGRHGTEHKNAEHNLVGLCESCHDRVHSGAVRIQGWKMTSRGRKLRYGVRLTRSDKRFIKARAGTPPELVAAELREAGREISPDVVRRVLQAAS